MVLRGAILTSTLAVIMAMGLMGCQTAASKDFQRIKPGMEKVDVVDIMGDPQRKVRRKGVDQWTYIYYDQSVRTENQVHFTEGVATYVGPYVPPAISAEQQDAIFAAENRELEKKLAERRLENNSNLERYESEMTEEDINAPTRTWEPVK